MIFQPFSKYFSYFENTIKVSSWISKGMSEESSFAPKWVDKYLIPRVKFNGNYLRQDNISFIHGILQTRYMFKRFKHRFHIR